MAHIVILGGVSAAPSWPLKEKMRAEDRLTLVNLGTTYRSCLRTYPSARWHRERGMTRPRQTEENKMTIDRAVMMFAGFMVLLSLALGHYVSPWWHLLTAFVGLNLIQASITGFCPAALVFEKVGCQPGAAFK